jgi:uncharacterized membrane protein
MTAITSARQATASDSLLRLAMRIDAIIVGLAGIALLAAAAPLSEFTGIPRSVEYGVGVFSVGYGILVFALAGLKRVRPAGIGTVIANAVCTVLAIVVVVAGLLPLTTAGVVLVIATGVYTAVFAELQYAGVRRIKA